MKKAIVLSLALTLALEMTGCAKTENAPQQKALLKLFPKLPSEPQKKPQQRLPKRDSTAAAEEASSPKAY